MDYVSSFGEWIKLRRQTLRVQRNELAAQMGCAAVTLRKIEMDERRPSRPLAGLLAQHLAIPLAEREQFIQVARGALPIDELPVPTAEHGEQAHMLTNLPLPTTSLVGREQDIESVCDLLADANLRMLTLTGAPGIGKTRLALAVAAAQQSAFADGVFFVDLTPVTEAAFVLAAIAHALHLAASDAQPPMERLSQYLRKRHMLLVLDNFEQVVEAAPQLALLLKLAPKLTILVTGRIALAITEEHRFNVKPLAFAPRAEPEQLPMTPVEAQRYASIDLFVQRARAASPSFRLTDANVESVCEICRCVDGMPLLIEFIAARTSLFTPAEHLQHLRYLFARVGNGGHDPSAQDTPMWFGMDRSYSLLAADDQRLLRRLSVLEGGWSFTSAQHLCDDYDALGLSLRQGIETLAMHSLLQPIEECKGQSLFGMFGTVRMYALHKLALSDEAERIRQRHAAYCLASAEYA